MSEGMQSLSRTERKRTEERSKAGAIWYTGRRSEECEARKTESFSSRRERERERDDKRETE